MKGKNPNSTAGDFTVQQTERKPLFDLGQLVATPGALAALDESGQSPMDFSRATLWEIDSYVESLWQQILWA
jgi:hypothetical protein